MTNEERTFLLTLATAENGPGKDDAWKALEAEAKLLRLVAEYRLKSERAGLKEAKASAPQPGQA